MKPRILVAAGGTGGHIFPALCVADELRDQFQCEVSFVGTGRELEQKLIAPLGYPLFEVPFVPILGQGLPGISSAFQALTPAIKAANRLFTTVRPDAVIGFGGYPSAIPMLYSFVKRVPRVLHEQNVKVGLANRLLSIIANRTFAVTGSHGFLPTTRVSFLENPVRRELYGIPELALPSDGGPLTVAVIGGSQGAIRLNSMVLELIGLFKEYGVRIIHQSGVADESRIKEAYACAGLTAVKVLPFIDDMPKLYRETHLVICRAGAITVAELGVAGRPAVFVPLSLAGGHQKLNPERLCRAGGAFMVPETPEGSQQLSSIVGELFRKPTQLVYMARAGRSFSHSSPLRPSEELARAVLSLIR